MSSQKIKLPDNLQGRSIHEKVIPTVCNLENMLGKLVKVDGDNSKLEQWEKRSYKAYRIEKIKKEILNTSSDEWKDIIKDHIISQDPNDLGASCIDVYLVAYVAENYGKGRQNLIQYVKDNGISDKENSAQAIWQVGRGDGEYLKVLNDDGTVRDWDFFSKWVGKEDQNQKQTKETNDELEALKEHIDTIDDKNKQIINDIKDKLHDLTEQVDQQNIKLQEQKKEIKELSEELKLIKRKNNLPLWKKVKKYFTQNM